jgi:hypothetical protein
MNHVRQGVGNLNCRLVTGAGLNRRDRHNLDYWAKSGNYAIHYRKPTLWHTSMLNGIWITLIASKVAVNFANNGRMTVLHLNEREALQHTHGRLSRPLQDLRQVFPLAQLRALGKDNVEFLRLTIGGLLLNYLDNIPTIFAFP